MNQKKSSNQSSFTQSISNNQTHSYYQQQQQLPKDYLKQSTFQYYSLGHVYNDLGGAMYFNYLFFFLKRVVKTPAASAVFLSGQVTDGAVTPALGYLCDRFGSKKFGQRTPWYFWGLIIFIIGYSFLYLNANTIFGGQLSSEWQYTYYIGANLLTNLGWACVQIANMSLVPTITFSRSRRSRLNNLRNSRTFICSLAVLVVGTVLFSVQKDASTIILQMMTGFGLLGIVCCIIYLIRIKQVHLSKGAIQCRKMIKQWIFDRQQEFVKKSAYSEVSNGQKDQILQNGIQKQKQFVKSGLQQLQNSGSQIQDTQPQTSQSIILLKWLKQYQFYLYALFYLSSRVYINVSGTFLPFLIVDILQFTQEGAIMPVFITINSLVITSFQIITTIFMHKLTKHYQSLFIYTVTGILSFFIGLLMMLLTPQSKYAVFLFAILIGITQAILLNVSIDLMNQMIGDKIKSSGVLIGIYGLLDKCSSGLIVYFITSSEIFDNDLIFKKIAVCIVPVSLLAISGILAIYKLIKQKKYKKKYISSVLKGSIRKSKQGDQSMIQYQIQNENSIAQNLLQQNKLEANIKHKIQQYKKDMIF